MAGIGDLLLGLRGMNNPREAMVAKMLGGGSGAGGRGLVPPPGAGAGAVPAPGQDVRTPAQPRGYQSPPDLLDAYMQLTDYDKRASQINKGIGLLGSAMSQPENRQSVYSAMAGEAPTDPMSLVLQLQEMETKAASEEAAAAEKARKQAALPALAEQLGIPLEQAQILFDEGSLDEVLVDRAKPQAPVERKTIMVEDKATGKQIMVYADTGETVREFDTGLAPEDAPKIETTLVEDKGTGNNKLINKETGAIIAEYPGGVTPTEDKKNYDIAVSQGYQGNFEKFLDDEANRKKPVTNIDINNAPNSGRVATEVAIKAATDMVTTRLPAARAAQNTIAQLAQAQNVLKQPGGIIAGSKLSTLEYEARKVLADLVGVPDDAVNNTATYGAAMGDAVRSKVKELGTGNSISNADRDYTEKTVGASGEIPPEAMPKILSIMEFGSRNEIIKYNKQVDKWLEAARDPETGKIDPMVEASFEKVDVPEISDDWMSFVSESDLNTLRDKLAKDGTMSDEDKKGFDDLYGPNAADAAMEKILNGY